MLSSSDIVAGKALVQLGFASSDKVRAVLRKIDAGEGVGDVIDRVAAEAHLDEAKVKQVRRCTTLYQKVRSESGYARLVPKHTPLSREAVNDLVAEVERGEFKLRLGEILEKRGIITKEQDVSLLAKERQSLFQEDQKTIDRYREEDFAGVARPLIPHSRLEVKDFKIARLPAQGREAPANPSIGTSTPIPSHTQVPATHTPPPAAERPRKHTVAQIEVPEITDSKPIPAALPATKKWEPDEIPDAKPVEKPRPKGKSISKESIKDLKRVADYTIVEVLGVGGMGAVFLGQKDGHSIYAAIKVLLNDAATDQEVKRFRREISLTRRVKHKNVIEILDAGETENGLTYLVVPALVAKELRAVIDATGGKGLPAQTACTIFERILEGMIAIHAARIIHRDMKPENVMVLSGKELQVKIMDLGLARLEGEPDPEDEDANFKTMVSVVTGSPMYMAPETIQMEESDHRTDIYSIGCMFFEMLAGRRPFDAETASGLMTQHLAAPPPLLREARPEREWPDKADDFIGKMMAKDPADRFATCQEILVELREKIAPLLIAAEAGGPRPEVHLGPKVAVAEAPPTTEKVAKEHWGVLGILGRLTGKGR